MASAKRVVRVLADALFTLVFLAALFATAVLLILRGNGSFCGMGVVRSGSMQASGLYPGDAVVSVPQSGYAAGDIILFYRAPSDYGQPFDGSNAGGYPVWIHEIIAETRLEDGRAAYLTKGSSNAFDDGFYVPQDFVLGKAVKLPPTLSAAVAFLSSATGILLLVVLPCAVMLVYLTWELTMLLTQSEKTEPIKARIK